VDTAREHAADTLREPGAFDREGLNRRHIAAGGARRRWIAEDCANHGAGDSDLGQLEGDGAGVADDAGPDLGQLELKAGQRPVGHRLGQFDAAQEGPRL
jgi:hypothetical protein